MIKLKKAIPICLALLLVEAIIFLFVIHNLNEEFEFAEAAGKGVFRKADTDEYYLNEGLYYLNGDRDSCYFKVEKKNIQNYLQLVVEDKERFHELYKTEITDLYNPDSTRYKDYDEWFDDTADKWSIPKNFQLVCNEILNPETIRIGYDWGFSENMHVILFLSCGNYVDHDTIQYSVTEDKYLTFTRLSE